MAEAPAPGSILLFGPILLTRHGRRLAMLSIVGITVAFSALPSSGDEGASGAPAEAVAISDTSGNATRPLELVRSSVSRVLAILQSQPITQPISATERAKRRAEVLRVAEGLFDFQDMARRMLAQHWQDGSPQQQREFVQVLRGLLERSYLTMVETYPPAAITFQDELISGLYAQVRSRVITDRGGETPIEYRLVSTDGRWAVYDVVVDGISLVSSYRSQFASILRRSSFDEFLDRLRNREAAAVPRQGP